MNWEDEGRIGGLGKGETYIADKKTGNAASEIFGLCLALTIMGFTMRVFTWRVIALYVLHRMQSRRLSSAYGW